MSRLHGNGRMLGGYRLVASVNADDLKYGTLSPIAVAYVPNPGTDITNAICEALEIVNHGGGDLILRHNSAAILVSRHTSFTDVMRAWEAHS